MPFYGVGSLTQGMNLQQTVSAATSNHELFTGGPHHPVTCMTGELFYDEDGSFSCEHAKAPGDDLRTQQAVTHSIAILLIELAMEL